MQILKQKYTGDKKNENKTYINITSIVCLFFLPFIIINNINTAYAMLIRLAMRLYYNDEDKVKGEDQKVVEMGGWVMQIQTRR